MQFVTGQHDLPPLLSGSATREKEAWFQKIPRQHPSGGPVSGALFVTIGILFGNFSRSLELGPLFDLVPIYLPRSSQEWYYTLHTD